MTIATALILIWLMGSLLYFIPKQLSFLQNVTVFMVLVMISRMVVTILDMELRYIETTQESIPHLAFLFLIELVKPLMVLAMINLYLHWGNPVYKGLLVFITFIAMNMLNVYALEYGLLSYVKWNLAYDLFYEGSYLILAFIVSQLVLRLKES